VTPQVLQFIGPSNDGRRHGRGTYLFVSERYVTKAGTGRIAGLNVMLFPLEHYLPSMKSDKFLFQKQDSNADIRLLRTHCPKGFDGKTRN
jgi:hypothetical protein